MRVKLWSAAMMTMAALGCGPGDDDRIVVVGNLGDRSFVADSDSIDLDDDSVSDSQPQVRPDNRIDVSHETDAPVFNSLLRIAKCTQFAGDDRFQSETGYGDQWDFVGHRALGKVAGLVQTQARRGVLRIRSQASALL